MKISIVIIAGFAMLIKRRITVSNSNENNLKSDLGFCILFYTEQKYCDILDNYAWSKNLE